MPPRMDSRPERLAAYVRHNGSRIFVDAALLSAWIIVAVWLFEFVEYHRWLLYFVVLLGVIVYTRITPPWERPYRSPDQPPAEDSEPAEN